MAAAFFNRLAETGRLPIRAESAGLFPVLDAATEEAITAAAEYGVDLWYHRSRQLTDAMVREADLILTMTEMQKHQIESRFAAALGITFTLRGYVGENGNIADPYGQSLAEYRRCAQRIWTGIEKVISHLQRSLQTEGPLS
jgi:protein-tyrosine-phosphatase